MWTVAPLLTTNNILTNALGLRGRWAVLLCRILPSRFPQRQWWLALCVLSVWLLEAPSVLGEPELELSAAARRQWQVALGHYRLRRWELAAEELQELLERFPRFPKQPQAQFLLGECSLQLGRYKQAVQAYQRCLRHAGVPRRWALRCRFRLGELALLQRQWNEAQKHLEPFVRQAPQDPWHARAMWYLALVHINQNQWLQAQAVLQQLLEKHPHSPLKDQALVALGRCYRRAGQFHQAQQVWQQVVQAGTPSAAWEAQFRLATLHYDQGRLEQAAQGLEHLLNQNPRSPWRQNAQVALAQIRLVQQNPQKALALLNQALTQPGDAEVQLHRLRVEALVQMARWEDAYQELALLAQKLSQAQTALAPDGPSHSRTQALLLTPERCWVQAGRLALKQAWWERAQRCFEQVVQHAPATSLPAHQARLGLIQLALRHNQPESALRHWQWLLQASPFPWVLEEGLWHLGRWALEHEEFDRLLAWLQQCRQSGAPLPQWQLELFRGMALYGQGKHRQALEVLLPLVDLLQGTEESPWEQTAQALPLVAPPPWQAAWMVPRPWQGQLWYTLGACYAGLHQWNQALVVLQHAQSLAQRKSLKAQVLAALVLVHLKSGQKEKALKALARLHAQFPGEPQALPWLVLVADELYAQGDWDQALKLYTHLAQRAQGPLQAQALSGVAWCWWEQSQREKPCNTFSSSPGWKKPQILSRPKPTTWQDFYSLSKTNWRKLSGTGLRWWRGFLGLLWRPRPYWAKGN